MNICIYGASGNNIAEEYFKDAAELGALIAKGGHTLVFGGGQSGLMGACAEGVHNEGGRLIGIAPRFFDEPGILCPYCTEFIYTETMRERKQLMEEKSDAFVVLPGGIGTFDEFFEMLTLKQLGRHKKPMAVLNTLNYYDAMMNMLKTAVSGGFLSKRCLEVFALCDSPAEAVESLSGKGQLVGSIARLEDYTK